MNQKFITFCVRDRFGIKTLKAVLVHEDMSVCVSIFNNLYFQTILSRKLFTIYILNF